MPQLIHDLVQAVVQISKGREGQWRLSMALKPQVLEGTHVVLDAQPGRLQVRFDCAGSDAGARLAEARAALQQRLVQALSNGGRAVDVEVDVQVDVPRFTQAKVVRLV